MSQSTEQKDIVIIGGGIIGCTTAYFLTRHPSYNPATHRITILEATTIANGASGKAGGLLALWAYPSSIVPLSYKLHADLAQEHSGAERWGFRRIHCGQLDAKGRPKPLEPKSNKKPTNGATQPIHDKGADVDLQKTEGAGLGKLRAAGLPNDLDWIASDSARSYSEMGTPDTTAQVHPRLFTKSMAALAQEKGVKIEEYAQVKDIVTESTPNPNAENEKTRKDRKEVKSVSWTSKDGTSHSTPASHVVVAAGPWTGRVLAGAPVSGLRAHSVTITPTRPVSAYALFTEIDLPATPGPKKLLKRSSTAAPEIYARPSEIYACGEGDRLVPLPATTEDVQTDQSRCQDIIDQVGAISDELRDGEVTARQACYLPVSSSGGGGPWIGKVASTRGLVLASGHSCWGIQNGPGTGKCVSEVVMEGVVRSAKLGGLEPGVSLPNL